MQPGRNPKVLPQANIHPRAPRGPWGLLDGLSQPIAAIPSWRIPWRIHGIFHHGVCPDCEHLMTCPTPINMRRFPPLVCIARCKPDRLATRNAHKWWQSTDVDRCRTSHQVSNLFKLYTCNQEDLWISKAVPSQIQRSSFKQISIQRHLLFHQSMSQIQFGVVPPHCQVGKAFTFVAKM